VVQRHGAGVELGGQPAHGHRVESLGIGDANGRCRDVVARESRLAAASLGTLPHVDGLEMGGETIE
jgi:hypothetical protein